MKTKAFYPFALSVLSLGCWLSAGSLLSSRAPKWLVAVGTAAWLILSTRVLAATRVRHKTWIYADLFVLALFSLLPFVLAYTLTDGLSSLGFGLFALSYPLAVLITMLLYIGVVSKTWQEAGIDQDSQVERKQSEWAMVIPVLSALTLVWWLFGSFVCGGQFGFFAWWLIALATVLLSVSAMVFAARRVSRNVWVLAALLILAALFLPASLLTGFFQAQGLEPFSSQQVMMSLLVLSTALVIVALLLHSGLKSLDEWRSTGALESGDSQAQRKRAGRAALLAFALGSFLLAKALYSLYWFMVWDATTDSLGYLSLAVPVPAVLLSGVVLCFVLPGRTKLAGLFYSLLIPAMLIGVSARAQHVDFHQLTEERAERITQAIEAYHAREGHYPQDLQELTPRCFLSPPGPVILYGQDWCYVGGEDYYRLGYLDREHWSSPILFGRLYSARGHSTLEVDACQSAIDTYRAQHPDWQWLQYVASPTPTPVIGD